MKNVARFLLSTALIGFAVFVFASGTSATAQTETVLHSFDNNGTDGYTPYAGLIFDAAGNLYGTAADTPSGFGTVFELSPQAGGDWTETVLFNFNPDGTGGYSPQTGLIFDSIGSLYGTTALGGAYGHGAVFELSPGAGGSWTEKVLHSFNYNGGDGFYPYSSLILDASGNLYGTTTQGGTYGDGTAFELVPSANGNWREKILHNFNPDRKDGTYPYASMIVDGSGNLYGVTSKGGAHDFGAVFELLPTAGGKWNEKLLHSFNGNGTDGYDPMASLVFDATGNLYGTTLKGGANARGVVFELTPPTGGGGGWTETVLYSFNNNGTDATYPYAGLVLDAAGDFYGTTIKGGVNGNGAVFELVPKVGGGWTEIVLHSFDNNGTDGYTPYGGLIVDGTGNLYGTTYGGGLYGNYGTVFEIMP